MSIQNINELFALDGPQFIAEAYLNLLQHEPDTQGMAYYLGRLAQGHSKESVIFQLAQSPDCRPHQDILGLEALVKAQRRTKHWFWGRVDRIARMERKIQELRLALATQQSAETSTTLPRETIRQAYLAVLGREPESETVISLHAQVGSVEALYQGLLSSEEYNRRVVRGATANQTTMEMVRQAYLAVLGREPESESVINEHMQLGDAEIIYKSLLSSEEYKLKLKEGSSFALLTSNNANDEIELTPRAEQIYNELQVELGKNKETTQCA